MLLKAAKEVATFDLFTLSLGMIQSAHIALKTPKILGHLVRCTQLL